MIQSTHTWTILYQSRIARHCGRCEFRWQELPLDHDYEREDAQIKAFMAKKAPTS